MNDFVPMLPESPEEKTWWLVVGGVAQGPHPAEAINCLLLAGTITRQTLACRAGTQVWRPLADWPELQDPSLPAPPPLPPPLPGASSNSHPLTNPRLPTMANAICVYGLLARPVICGIGLLAALLGGRVTATAEDMISFLVMVGFSLSITTLLFVGGLRLRDLRAGGSTMIRTAIWFSLAGTALAIFVILLVALASTPVSPDAQQAAASAPPAETMGSLFFLLVWLLELGFQIAALVWLSRYGRTLPYVAR